MIKKGIFLVMSSKKSQSPSFSADNSLYIEDLYQKYLSNPEQISSEWKNFFDGFEFAKSGSNTSALSEKELDVYNLIQAYRDYGHFEANLDPLSNTVAPSDLLRLSRFNLTDADLNSNFKVASLIGLPDAPLKDVIQHLKNIYCGTLSIQASDALPDIKTWFIHLFEKNLAAQKTDASTKKVILTHLAKAESIEKFIHTRYVGTKRFSIEGGDAVIPMLETLAQKASALKVEELVLGMAHRGRINVLVNFMEKNVGEIFADFNGPTQLEVPLEDFDGDVKYHLGYNKMKKTESGQINCHLAFNPSHLEAVDPVVLGQARALQRKHADTEQRKKVIPVLIHGDAAFAGQGVVTEVLQMADVRGYKVGGTIHIVIDNQLGFTTNPENARSSHYSSDAAKVTSIPVLHCNGDDPEACVRAMEIALKYRQEWSRDIVINVSCYRRFGHNEGDEPAYTQPLMYDIIKKHQTPREIYAKKIISENILDQNASDQLLTSRMNELQKFYEDTKSAAPKHKVFKFDGYWQGLKKASQSDIEKVYKTSLDPKDLEKVGLAACEIPSGFNLHPKLTKLIEQRKNMAKGSEPCDWGMAELLAYGSLLQEKTSVRLTGQDCVRGTFTHRHSAFYDTQTNEAYFPLKKLETKDVRLCIYDSILSEYAVLGFEYGNSITDPSFLNIWEAQFGDFANGAQIMIDQFVAAGETKWQQMSGLVLLLPHGYEGQGPEHSSARLERFLQLAAQNNMTVANLSTPAQIFHALRRQVKRDFRKPLVVMSPKSLLRHPRATNSIKEIAEGQFFEVLDDQLIADKNKIEKVVLVSGKLYYELLEQREKLKDQKTALIRLEQIAPFPAWALKPILSQYKNLKQVVWTQEEPKNMGSFQYVYFKLADLLKTMKLNVEFDYVGRPDRASPATGSIYRHKTEQTEIIEKVFSL